MKPRLKAGIIGLGGMGMAGIERLRAHPQVDVVALAEIDAERLATAGRKSGIEARYADPVAMLEAHALDLVYISTPNRFHAEQTVAALEHGCHVLCEKPMAMTSADAEQMVATAARKQKRLMINFSFRFREGMPALRDTIAQGTLGDIYYARSVWLRRDGLPGFGGWFGQKALSGGGPIIDLGVHMLDIALWFMNNPTPRWVMASTYNAVASAVAKAKKATFDVEDFGCATIKCDNGATLDLTTSWISHIKDAEVMETHVLGTKGGLVQRWGRGEIFTTINGTQYDTTLVKTPPPPSSLYDFADCILTDRPHTATGEEGLRVMRIIEAIYQSAAENRPIELGTVGTR